MLQQAGHGENIADVVVHHQNFSADQDVVALVHLLDFVSVGFGKFFYPLVKKKDHVIHYPLRAIGFFDDADLGGLFEFFVFLRIQIAVEINHRG